jgi:hypothetical protein
MQTDHSLISSERSHMFAAALLFRVGAVVVIAGAVAIGQPLTERMIHEFLGIAALLFFYNLTALLWRRRIEPLLARYPWLLAIDLTVSVALLTVGCGWRNPYFVYTLTTPILFVIFLRRRGAWAVTAVFVGGALIKEGLGWESAGGGNLWCDRWDLRASDYPQLSNLLILIDSTKLGV